MTEIDTKEVTTWIETEVKELMKAAKKNREAGNDGQYYNNLKMLDYLMSINQRI